MQDNVTALQQLELDELDELYSILGFDPAMAEGGQEVPQRFIVQDLEQLNWAFRKLDAYAAKLANVKALKDAEQKRLDDWFAGETKDITARVEFMERMVREYAERMRKADSKYKGEKTPFGGVSFTKSQPDWVYKDEAATVAFLKADEKLAEHVKTTEAIANKTDIKKVLEIKRNVFLKDGEVVDIAEATPGGWIGMQYAEYWKELSPMEWEEVVKDLPEHATITGDAESGGYLTGIIDISTGEFVGGVELVAIVAVHAGRVVPGVVVSDKPDRINISKPK